MKLKRLALIQQLYLSESSVLAGYLILNNLCTVEKSHLSK